MKLKFDEAKEYLESIKRLSQEALNLADEVDELRAVAISCTVQTDKDCVQSSSEDKMANIIGQIITLEKRIEQIRKIYWQRRKIVSRFLLSYNDEKVSDFIEMRFIQEKSIYVVCAKMDLSETTARRIQRKIILDFAEYYGTVKDSIKN